MTLAMTPADRAYFLTGYIVYGLFSVLHLFVSCLQLLAAFLGKMVLKSNWVSTVLRQWKSWSAAYSVSQKIPPWDFLTFFPKRLGIFGPNFTCLLSDPIYVRLQILFNYLQRWRSYAILSATTIICSKCPPSAETNARWSHHLIWHNFVKVGDNWIKFVV